MPGERISPADGARQAGLRLCLVTETFPPEINGVAMTLRRLVDGLVARGHRIMVVRPRQAADAGQTLKRQGAVVEILRPGLPIPGYGTLRFGLPSARCLRTVWRRHRPDVVHLATEGPLGSSALSAARRLGLPVTSTFHTDFADYCRRYRCSLLAPAANGWLRRFHNRTQVTMVPSEDLAQRLDRNGFRNLAILARGVDARMFDPARRDPDLRRAWGVEDAGLAILHVGRVAQEKNLPLLFTAFEAVNRQRIALGLGPARLVVVGDGPLRERLAAQHPQVRFTGALPADDLARHFASADVFLFPSLSETFGNVLLEAMASGLACVGFRYAAAERHAHDEADALLAAYGDEPAFIAAAVRLGTDADLRGRLRLAARATAEGIGWDRVVSRFEEMLRCAANAALADLPSPSPGSALAIPPTKTGDAA